MKQTGWVVANLGRMAKQQRARLQRMPPPAIPEQEQIRRFLSGEERYRVEQGLVSPREWAEYESAMLQKLGV